MTTPTAPPASRLPQARAALHTLTSIALGLTVLVAVQVVLGIVLLADVDVLKVVHSSIGFALLVGSIVGAVYAFKAKAAAAQLSGLFMHAVTIPVLLVLQIGLGEMELTSVHMLVGVLAAGAIVALFTISRRRGTELVDPEPADTDANTETDAQAETDAGRDRRAGRD